MGTGQYRGWISESWLDKGQKSRLGWKPSDAKASPNIELFTKFRALPDPLVPKPGQSVSLKLDWPANAKVKKLRVRIQTALNGPWVEMPAQLDGEVTPDAVGLGSFDRSTPVSYRIDAE